jgi:hypothetical protein
LVWLTKNPGHNRNRYAPTRTPQRRGYNYARYLRDHF